ncbi:OLC1v1006912C1 [Oldenlandia corymbosa var. corymbosa]|uniref:OLC1v1006912C1 n=1 Tax=Oldenlandia corymbosa var. corymbosa TaxID=529605 RepID=A0AAV1DIR6_OLDCO|nr:OLC1v1006912C1 [Oldenlandia corymbosa var. corymbosa]
MRRQQAAADTLAANMEKEQGKSRHSRICLLVTLTAFFWVGLFYFHFEFIGGNSVVVQSIQQQLTPVSESSSNRNTVHALQNPRPLLVTSPPKVDDPQPVPVVAPILRNGSRNSDKRVSVNSEIDNDNASPPKVDASPSKVDASSQSISNGSSYAQSVQVVAPTLSNSSSNAQSVPVVAPTLSNSSSNSAEQQSVNISVVDNAGNKVEDYPFMKALRTADNKSDPCGGRYIYVHDLPPRFNVDMLKECKSLSLWTNMCKFISNAGLGPPLENVEGVFSNTGFYATNQFAVDVIFNNRMKQYDCLTTDSSLAAAIFVPFYAGFDIARYLWGYNTSMRDAASLALIDWLTKKPEWGIMGGKDHFLVAGRITWDFRRKTDQERDWGNKLLFLPEAKNMSMLVVEASSWNFNDFGIPYPTYFHPAKDEEVFIWQDRMRKTERKWLFCFAGGRRPGDRKSIRDQIIDQCKNSKVCKLLECAKGQSKCHSPSTIMQMFQSSVFCLQPQGDSYTRRSAFDSILAGCIPVFFHPASAYTQYIWHLPKNVSKYSVLIPENDIRKNNISIEQLLSRYTAKQIKEMGEEVIKLIPTITYADPRSKLETVKDAFDVAVEAIIKRVTKLRKDVMEGYRDDGRDETRAWKYALMDEGQHELLPHEWDSLFVNEPDEAADSSGSAVEAAKNSWKTEHGQQ